MIINDIYIQNEGYQITTNKKESDDYFIEETVPKLINENINKLNAEIISIQWIDNRIDFIHHYTCIVTYKVDKEKYECEYN